jgi:UDP-N-acetylmuramate dehydrogenase
VNIQENISLKAFNTFGIEAYAKYYTEVSHPDEVRELLAMPLFNNNPGLILGGGSNVLFCSDLDGLVVRNKFPGLTIKPLDEDHVLLECGAGENWHQLVCFAVENNLGGIENLSLIPGCVGAGPMQNIGAYGVELKDVFESLEAIHLKTGETVVFNKTDCEFGYRESVFKNKYKNQFIITKVTLRLSKKPQLNTSYGAIEQKLEQMGLERSVLNVSKAVIAIRQEKLPNPAEIGNAGSFFKNPVVAISHYQHLQNEYSDIPSYPVDELHVKVPAGWLIERAGFKGMTRGNYGVHRFQALVLVNYGGAEGRKIYELSEEIMTTIQAKFGIQLEREVNIIGWS